MKKSVHKIFTTPNMNYSGFRSETDNRGYFVIAEKNRNKISLRLMSKEELLFIRLSDNFYCQYYEKFRLRKEAEERLEELKSSGSQELKKIISENNPEKLNLFFSMQEK